MKSLLFWLLPPLAGAVIGYVTNAIAIKMLFRPLKEIRLFGLRLPFTPGILPRERRKLADSIGGMVERELLTAGVIRERLASTEVREKMGGALGSYTEQMLERPLSYWLEDRSGDFPLAELFGNFIYSDVFNSFLEELIRAWAGVKVSSSGWNEEKLGSRLKSRVGAMVIPAARDLIKSGLVKEVKDHARGKKSVYRQTLEKIIDKYPGITLKEFLSLGDPQKKSLDFFLTENAATAADKNIEGALSSVNVKTLVSNRINSLDMIRVEKIILDVMAGQLKWINFFGAILGALIGFLQVFLSVFFW